jgi:hypothetical protein
MTTFDRPPGLEPVRGTSTPRHSMQCAMWNTETRARAGFAAGNGDSVSVARLCHGQSDGGAA